MDAEFTLTPVNRGWGAEMNLRLKGGQTEGFYLNHTDIREIHTLLGECIAAQDAELAKACDELGIDLSR